MRDELGLVASEGPGLVAPAGRGGVGGRHLDSGARPEPAVDSRGLEILAVAALEVAEPARGPDVREVVVLDELLDELVLGRGLEADPVREVFFISGEPVVVTAVLKMFGTIGAFFRIWEC